MRRLLLPGIPFLLSFALSLSTAGSHVYWQDSGFFLVAVKELGVLYPPGFVLYVLLCKVWTLALWWVDFTYAVHLFSATCAALAAGTLAVAARDLLRTKGPLFHNSQEAGPLAEWVGVSIGCLAASGYTFWASAILAKVYAFYYLILTLLIWRLIRADESGKPRDFTWVAVLIGLGWQAHPSATNAGLALLLFVGFHWKAVGGRGLAWRMGLAALCALGPIPLLPIMARQGSVLRFGNPDTWDEFWNYARGSRFTSISGAFGLEYSRVASVFRYGWEEFLGVGLLLIAGGVYRLWLENRRLLFGIATWVLPVLVVTVLFKQEGQHDFWMVAAWIPLWLVAAAGLSLVGKVRETAVILALIGVVWAVFVNRKDLDQRDYTLAETFGHYFLDRPTPGSGLFLESDDAQALSLYLQRVRGLRTDLTLRSGIFNSQPSGNDAADWYMERPASPVVLDELEKGSVLSPVGAMTRSVSKPPWKPDSSVWREPIPAEEIPKLLRRARGQQVTWEGYHRVSVAPEPYEMRLFRTLLLARCFHAIALSREGNLSEAARLYESVFAADPATREEPVLIYSVAVLQAGLGRYREAEMGFRKLLEIRGARQFQPRALYFLAALCGDRPEGAEWKKKALNDPELPTELRLKLDGR